MRGRLLLTLGLVLTPAAMGTYATWSDTSTISGMEIHSGTLDLAVGAGAGDQLTGQGGTWNYAALSLSAMLPGESIAQPLTVRNAGSTPLKYSATASTSSNGLSPSLKLTAVPGAAVGSSGSQTAGNRAGTCSGGGSSWVTGASVSTTPTAAFPTTPVVLQPGDTTSVCVLVALDAAAGNGLQSQTVTLTIVVTASQP